MHRHTRREKIEDKRRGGEEGEWWEGKRPEGGREGGREAEVGNRPGLLTQPVMFRINARGAIHPGHQHHHHHYYHYHHRYHLHYYSHYHHHYHLQSNHHHTYLYHHHIVSIIASLSSYNHTISTVTIEILSSPSSSLQSLSPVAS